MTSTTPPSVPSTEDRLAAVEAAIAALASEVVTRRLVVNDDQSRPRIAIETAHGTAEVRVSIPSPPGRSCDVSLFAQAEDPRQPGQAMGVSWMVEGDQFAVVEAASTDGGWRMLTHLPIED